MAAGDPHPRRISCRRPLWPRSRIPEPQPCICHCWFRDPHYIQTGAAHDLVPGGPGAERGGQLADQTRHPGATTLWRPPSGSEHQVRDALQPLPVYVVLLRLLLPFSVFKGCFPRMHQTNNARFLDLLWRHVLSLGLLTVAFLVSYSRVYLLYHTWSQVLYGGIAGGLMAIAWFVFTQEVLTPLFPRIAAWPISEFFLIRDTSLIPNVLWFEYTVTRAEARNRQRKLGTKLQ
ncbi:dolichyldiphosphatase 1 isoform X2 [Odocoileus virginianus]|uniref:Dolichyldiphosphatase 1 n=1 Tax=Odocoileus virginianus TaxID=9874 RepID=A0A6J0W2N6_ODOVR|nr:dolichyldiphosphatase 1 isoform X3 [Odocoileus virginianus texanus]